MLCDYFMLVTLYKKVRCTFACLTRMVIMWKQMNDWKISCRKLALSSESQKWKFRVVVWQITSKNFVDPERLILDPMKNTADPDPGGCDPRSRGCDPGSHLFWPLIPDPIYLVTTLSSHIYLKSSKPISDIPFSYFNGVKNETNRVVKVTRPLDFVCQFLGVQIGSLKKKNNNKKNKNKIVIKDNRICHDDGETNSNLLSK